MNQPDPTDPDIPTGRPPQSRLERLVNPNTLIATTVLLGALAVKLPTYTGD